MGKKYNQGKYSLSLAAKIQVEVKGKNDYNGNQRYAWNRTAYLS